MRLTQKQIATSGKYRARSFWGMWFVIARNHWNSELELYIFNPHDFTIMVRNYWAGHTSITAKGLWRYCTHVVDWPGDLELTPDTSLLAMYNTRRGCNKFPKLEEVS